MALNTGMIIGGETASTSGVVGALSITERYLIEGDKWTEVMAQRGMTLASGQVFPGVNQQYPEQTNLLAADYRPVTKVFSPEGIGWIVDVVYNTVGAEFNFTPVNPASATYNQHFLRSRGMERVEVPIMTPRPVTVPVASGSPPETKYEYERGGFDVLVPASEYSVVCNFTKPSAGGIQIAANILNNSKLQHIHQFGGVDWLMTSYDIEDRGVDSSLLQITYSWRTMGNITSTIIDGIVAAIGGDDVGIDPTKPQVPAQRLWWQKWEAIYGLTGFPEIPQFAILSPFEVDANGHTSLPLGTPF